jgi:leader peptidase (prepilin peptidase)/N-methyltransferase
MPALFVHFLLFVFGLIVGSFLNCLIYRLSLSNFSLKSFFSLKERSYCPFCKHILGWSDLIPVLSFFLLKGKCRYCQKKISLQYPLVELVTAILFVLIFQNQSVIHIQGWTVSDFATLFYLYAVLCFLVIIFVYDLKHYLIPDKIVYSAIGLVFAFSLFSSYVLNQGSFLNLLLSAFLSAAFFLLIVLVSRGKGMGLGDVKLAFFMGLFLGWPNILVALFTAFFIGALIGIILVFFGKKTLKSEVPFGPFLIIGTLVSFFFSSDLIGKYFSLFF